LQGWLGQAETIAICRVRCKTCRAVFTVLPSFILRYRRQDADCLGKLLELNLGMGLTLRETATIYSWLGAERKWNPGWIWRLVQWLGNLLPVCFLLLQMGLTLPEHLLSDDKFALLDGERIYLFLVSQGELVWYGEWMENLGQSTFERTMGQFFTTMDSAGQVSGQLEAEAAYVPVSVTTDGWQPAQSAWKVKVPGIDLLECNWHGQTRVSASLDEFTKAVPDFSSEQLQQIEDDLNSVLNAPSLGAFSQRIRRNRERYEEHPILMKRLDILFQKRFLFTNHLKHPEASAYSAPLDRAMRFLDEKLRSFGQYRSAEGIDPMLNAWAIVNDLRAFLPGARKAGQSLAEFFGAKFKGLPWMEVLNLCTVGKLETLLPSPT
jgi:hypothetical protein